MSHSTAERKCFFFKSNGSEKFDLMGINPGYWTVEHKKGIDKSTSSFAMHRFYRIEPKSNEIMKLVDSGERLQRKSKSRVADKFSKALRTMRTSLQPQGLTSRNALLNPLLEVLSD